MSKFKLGPIQEMWLQRLENNPKLQMKSELGFGNPKNYKACCLGEALLCIYRHKKKKLPFVMESIVSGSSYYFLKEFNQIGLYDDTGTFIKSYKYHDSNLGLSGLNDKGFTWPEIAAIIRRNPRNVFKESK